MSDQRNEEPVRYELEELYDEGGYLGSKMTPQEDGGYVRIEELAAVTAEVARLTERNAELQGQLQAIEDWNAETVETKFDTLMDAAMKLIRNRREKHELVDCIASGLRKNADTKQAAQGMADALETYLAAGHKEARRTASVTAKAALAAWNGREQ